MEVTERSSTLINRSPAIMNAAPHHHVSDRLSTNNSQPLSACTVHIHKQYWGFTASTTLPSWLVRQDTYRSLPSVIARFYHEDSLPVTQPTVSKHFRVHTLHYRFSTWQLSCKNSQQLQIDPRNALYYTHHDVHEAWRLVWYDKLTTEEWRPSPVYHTKRPPKLTTLATVDVQLQNVSKSKFGTRFQREVPSFLEICEFSSNTVWDQPRVACIVKKSFICWAVSIQYQLVTETYTGPWLIPRHASTSHHGTENKFRINYRINLITIRTILTINPLS